MLSKILRTSVRRISHGFQQLSRPARHRIPYPQDGRFNNTSCPSFSVARCYIISARNPTSERYTPSGRQSILSRKASTKTGKRQAAAKIPKRVAAKRKTTPKTKAKPKRKVLTEEQKLKVKKAKDAAEKKALRASVLKPPKPRPTSAWVVYITDHIKDKLTTMPFGLAMREIAAEFKALPSQEREQYEMVAQQNKTKKESDYQTWLETHRPEQIHSANRARKLLNRKFEAANPGKQSGSKYTLLQDSRLPKRPSNAYSLFVVRRWSSGDFKGVSVSEAGREIAKQWREMSPKERKVFEDDAAADYSRYEQAYNSAIGRAA